MKKYKSIPAAFSYSYEDAFVMEDMAVRHLFLNQEIDESVVNNIIYHIIRFNRLDKDVPADERTPIWLYINSPGGALTDSFGLVDVIKTSTTPVYTVNLALAASGAFHVFIAGKKRYAMPSSEFLIHELRTGDLDGISKVMDRMSFEAGEISDMLKDHVLSHTSIDPFLYDTKLRSEWYMLATQAKGYGIVDYIVGEDCQFDDIL